MTFIAEIMSITHKNLSKCVFYIPYIILCCQSMQSRLGSFSWLIIENCVRYFSDNLISHLFSTVEYLFVYNKLIRLVGGQLC